MPETINLEMRGGDFGAVVDTGGDGPPLLYLHGAVGQKGWAPFLERLSRQFTVYAPYTPGYGEATGLEHSGRPYRPDAVSPRAAGRTGSFPRPTSSATSSAG